MVDIEKVIKGLECCTTKPEHDCEKCPYEGKGDGWPCHSPQMKSDALELLKEQKQEITFLKGMQLQMTDHLSEEDLGNMVRNIILPK